MTKSLQLYTQPSTYCDGMFVSLRAQRLLQCGKVGLQVYDQIEQQVIGRVLPLQRLIEDIELG